MGLLDGKVALITGAARGQGRNHAIRMAMEGADIIAFDICGDVMPLAYQSATFEDLSVTRAAVVASGRRIVDRIGDVRSQSALDDVVRDGIAELGRIDIVVANAGVCSWGRFWELSEEEWTSLLDVNLSGVWRTFRAAAPALIEQGDGGSMIAISSLAGTKALPGVAHYSAAKHGVVGLTKAAAIELGPYGIRVNSVHPGAVATEMAQGNAVEQILQANPSFRPSFTTVFSGIQQSDDISDMVLFLASAQARCITGAQFAVDQGGAVV